MNKKTLWIVIIAGIVILAIGYYLQDSDNTASGKTLVYCSEGSPEGFDPARYTAGTTFNASSRTVYNRLVEFEIGTLNLEPALAESWDLSADGLSLTFNLRKGVKFHSSEDFKPTRDFNADDVIFTFNRQKNKDHPLSSSNISWEYFDSMDMGTTIESIEKIDDYTVRFNLTRPEAPIISNLSMDFASILSLEYAEASAAAGNIERINTNPIGTGPFEFVEYQKDSSIRYKAFEDHWRGKQALDNLVFAIVVDPTVRAQKIVKGECHVVFGPNPADIASLSADSNINVLSQEGLNVGYLAHNTTLPPFDNPKVRKAINYAINGEDIIKVVFDGNATKAKNPIPPTMWGYNNAITDDVYDPELAKKILAEENVTNLSMEIWAMPVTRPYNPNAQRMAELIQSDLANIGVEAKIVSYEWAEYLERSRDPARKGSVLLGWTGDNGDPDNFLYVLLSCAAAESGGNRAFFCNEKFDSLITQAKQTFDLDERIRLYEEAQVVFKEEAPWFTVAHSIVFVPIRSNVVGFKVDPLGGFYFAGVDLTE